MKSKSIFALIVVFALAVTVFALDQTHTLHFGNSDCCFKNDVRNEMKSKVADSDVSRMRENCPMKARSSEAGMNCENCPLKAQNAGSGEMSCDNCPMKANRGDRSPVNCPMKASRDEKSTDKP